MEEPKQYVKDGDYLRYYTNNDGNGIWTIQHNELFDGKIEINPEWEVLQEEGRTIYVAKPKKENMK